MANCTATPPVEPTYTLELSNDEARYLRALLGHLHNDEKAGVGIYIALGEAGVNAYGRVRNSTSGSIITGALKLELGS